jgi:hypothetical protein
MPGPLLWPSHPVFSAAPHCYHFSASLRTKSHIQRLATLTSHSNQRFHACALRFPTFIMRAPPLPPTNATSHLSCSASTIIQSQTSLSSIKSSIIASAFVPARYLASLLLSLVCVSLSLAHRVEPPVQCRVARMMCSEAHVVLFVRSSLRVLVVYLAKILSPVSKSLDYSSKCLDIPTGFDDADF